MTYERAFVISLDIRQDRLETFRRETESITSIPTIELWPAIHGDTCQPPDIWKAGAGAWGCFRSHVNILEYCLNNMISSYIVFEDDAVIRHDFDGSLRLFQQKTPPDWQQVYLGGQLLHEVTHPPERLNSSVYRPYNVNRTHCFAVSRTGMLPIYQHINNFPYHQTEHFDSHLGRWHGDIRNKVYCPGKWLVGQMGSSSNVSGKTEPVTFYSDPESHALSHHLFDNPTCVLFRGSSTLLRASKAYLYPGNNLDAHGYDVTLAIAARYADPIPDINQWYQWVRSEIVRDKGKAIPCLFHPLISKEQIEAAGISNVIEIFPNTIDDIKAVYARLMVG